MVASIGGREAALVSLDRGAASKEYEAKVGGIHAEGTRGRYMQSSK